MSGLTFDPSMEFSLMAHLHNLATQMLLLQQFTCAKELQMKNGRFQTCPCNKHSNKPQTCCTLEEAKCVILLLKPAIDVMRPKICKAWRTRWCSRCYVRREEWPPRDMKAREAGKNIWSWISFSPSRAASPVIVLWALSFWKDSQQKSALLVQMSSEWLETRLLHNRPCVSGGGRWWRLMRLLVCLFSHLLHSTAPGPFFLKLFFFSVMFKIFQKQLLTLIIFRLIQQLIKLQETHKINLKIKHTFVNTYTLLDGFNSFPHH